LRGRVAEVVAVSVFATIVTVVIAAPVFLAMSERVFGMEIVGRHHDPFTVMEQFGRAGGAGVQSQPVTDITGALLARMSGAVAAYNWLVLLTFPLSAAAAYLLARYLALSPTSATVVAMAYAFSPFHLAHAAYHPHIAQTQWIPVYLLSLWWCLDRASPLAVAVLGAAALAVTLSNFYGGFIAAVITPVAVIAYWLSARRGEPGSVRRLGVTIGSLGLIGAAGIAYAVYVARAVFVNRAAFAFPRADLFRYSAKWWSYLVPPIEHPLFGAAARRVWTAVGVREGLLEQQVYLGWGIVTLGLIAVVRWLVPRHAARPSLSLSRVPVLMVVAVAALVCSLSPERTVGTFRLVRPSALLYEVLPMFRSYARFGVVVQLMAALLAGIGMDVLVRTGTRRARIVCIGLVALAAGEYAVSPFALWRDALPTTAHRWVAQQATRVRVLDCRPLTQESESIQWLTDHRVTLGSATSDCTEPNLSQKLAGGAYTHLLVGLDTDDGRWFESHPTRDGLEVAEDFKDSKVFVVTARIPAIYTAAMTGFSPREHDAERSWQWMGTDAAWTIVNTSDRSLVATLALEMSAFDHARRLELRLDARSVPIVAVVDPARRIVQIGPLMVPPGQHELLFHPVDVPTVASEVINNGDGRPLSFAFGTWHWTVLGHRP
jgi:hypothetical protein